eukprot:TRINITY_DN24255_c0_g1_i1.p1 TRINITY_DN24255_c0_g1~~TRINITY_DN24255_c0_g1_i1.p1  ORF type:complete len:214 (+),score=90.90 TRINITY_DN24255_c0_g1_i1:163-804(+)
MVLSENWLLYSYWAGRPVQAQFSVLELYEPELDWNSGRRFSSWNASEPSVLAQAYTFESAIDALTVSQTRHGIAAKAVLVGLASGQVAQLPKAWFDPRRPSPQVATQADRDEGLVPYASSDIPIQPRAFINYYKRVGQLRQIETAPTALESTSLVAVVGLDLFFTRISPVGTFDQLAQDFSPISLLSTLVALAALSLFTTYYARRKDLLRRWK